MTLALVQRQILLNGVPAISPAEAYVPYGKTATAILPDGSSVVGVWMESLSATTPNDHFLRVWKLDAAFDVVGEVDIPFSSPAGVRIVLTATEGNLVHLLGAVGSTDTGVSVMLDCSGDDPVELERWDDPYSPNIGAREVHSLYLREIGVVACAHGDGVTIYRRGRPLVRRAITIGGGMWPHPTNPRKFGLWCFATGVYEGEAYEFEVTENDSLTYAEIPAAKTEVQEWFAGASNPFDADPVVMFTSNEDTAPFNEFYKLFRCSDPDTPIYSSASLPDGEFSNVEWQWHGIYGESGTFIFTMEISTEDLITSGGYFYQALGVVRVADDDTVSFERIVLPYGATSPDGEPEDRSYVSLITGSIQTSHRDGRIVTATCIVQQEGADDYYSVVAWGLTGGSQANPRLDTAAGWRRIGNGGPLDGKRLKIKTSDGWLAESTEQDGIDETRYPLKVKTESGQWELATMVTGVGGPSTSPEPTPPGYTTVDWVPASINVDLAAAVAIGEASQTVSGGSHGPFAAQAVPAVAADLVDGSDATYTTLATPLITGAGTVDLFTCRLVPSTSPPAGAEPIKILMQTRGQMVGANSFEFDLKVAVPSTKASMRNGQFFRHLTGAFVTRWQGIYNAPLDLSSMLPGFVQSSDSVIDTIDEAWAKADERSARWWLNKLEDPLFYIAVMPGELDSTAAGSVQLSELKFVVQYLEIA